MAPDFTADLPERLRFDARWHDISTGGQQVSTDEMKDSAKLLREAADRIEALERTLSEREGRINALEAGLRGMLAEQTVARRLLEKP